MAGGMFRRFHDDFASSKGLDDSVVMTLSRSKYRPVTTMHEIMTADRDVGISNSLS